MIKGKHGIEYLEDCFTAYLNKLDKEWPEIPDADIHGLVKHKAKREAILELRREMEKSFPEEFNRRDLSKRFNTKLHPVEE